MSADLPSPLRGIVPPMVTPLLDRDTLDREGLERLIEHMVGGGVHGLFLLGTTGEGPSLSYRLRRELVERVCAQVGGRVPVLVGITDTAFTESVQMARWAQEKGAAAAVTAPPYYFPAGQPELLEYLEHLSAELPLPLFLYNMPTHTKLHFEPETMLRAARLPNIVGLKDSSANMVYFHTMITLLGGLDDFSLLIGPEEMVADAVFAGGHGGVSGGANMAPKLYVDLYEAACAEDVARVRTLQDSVMKISTGIYNVGQHSSKIIKGIKCSLDLMGICSDFMAEPFHKFHEPERARVREILEEIGLLS